jgi:hypothetical protein
MRMMVAPVADRVAVFGGGCSRARPSNHAAFPNVFLSVVHTVPISNCGLDVR